MNASAAVRVNVQRPQRAARGRTTLTPARPGVVSARPRGEAWSWAEEGLAVAAAEQEDEPFQVLVQLGNPVGGVAGEVFQ